MSPTAGEKAHATIQRRKERLRLKKHALAQQKYRERNGEVLREKARESMRRHRAAIKDDAKKSKAAREQRREIDAEYRERQRQKRWIKRFGEQSFKDYYIPLSRLHGRETSKLQFNSQQDATSTMPLRTLRIPPAIEHLDAAPADFTPCRLEQRFGGNFDNHQDFSRLKSKTYWLCLSVGEEAVYTLKADCLAAKPAADDERDVVASCATWADVLVVWAAVCFHRHRQCARHPKICGVTECPTHVSRPAAATRRRVKVETSSPRARMPKVERSTPKLSTARRSASTAASRAASAKSRRSRVARSSVEDEDAPGKVPLYDPDTPPPRAARLPSSASTTMPLYDSDSSPARRARLPSVEVPLYDPDSPPSRTDKESGRAPSAASSPEAPSPVTSATVSTASSLSASTVDGASNLPATAHKGKARAVPLRPRSGTAPAGGSSSTPLGEGRGSTTSSVASGVYYVSAAGEINRDRQEAFKTIGQGPIKVVIGWDAAADYAERVALEGEQAMEVDI
ncbi:hypothetical protein B0H16DRAFT_1749487 [Mycena metata]|uniref:Uncharacterized protein n=1 Tax=Mycena metata TaxID=1033252 RepID=A0AAD7GKC7_9AGAR|nr:hypothetical protein B0H16DRAFT_1749487 [Mycena metata]